MVNKALISQWCEALRNCKVKQARNWIKCEVDGELQIDAVGVLLDIIDPNGWCDDPLSWPGAAANKKLKYFVWQSGDMYTDISIPREVIKLLGVDEGLRVEIINLNDKRLMSFSEIADWLEKVYLEKN